MTADFSFLRKVLLADAALSGAAGIAMVLAPGAVLALLGLPSGLMTAAGLVLSIYALGVAALAHRPVPPRGAVLALVAINILWGVECLVLPAFGWVEPTGLGLAFLIAQAAFVAVMADLQWIALRRAKVPA